MRRYTIKGSNLEGEVQIDGISLLELSSMTDFTDESFDIVASMAVGDWQDEGGVHIQRTE